MSLTSLPCRHSLQPLFSFLFSYSEDPALTDLKRSVSAIPHVGQLVHLTRTGDQAKAVMTFLDAIGDKGLRTTVSLTAGRGRGKSAAIGKQRDGV
ncbi:hypothetical protein EON63_15450 [archaeon]|nr:MAG: hypothetical protein EON63_15450 [archaeon]